MSSKRIQANAMKTSETHGGTVLCASQDRQKYEEGISA